LAIPGPRSGRGPAGNAWKNHQKRKRDQADRRYWGCTRQSKPPRCSSHSHLSGPFIGIRQQPESPTVWWLRLPPRAGRPNFYNI